MVKVKICGITDVATAVEVAKAGADAIGLVFAPSRRQVTEEQARAIVQQLPPFITKVGVFVNESSDEVNRVARSCGLDVVQLHGQESPDYCRQMEKPVVKGVSVKNAESLTAIKDYQVQAILLDTYHPEQAGGTGETFDWSLTTWLGTDTPVILAGGLGVDNVREALDRVQPYGVDVSSGVETNGSKDIQKIRDFISRVKGEVKHV